MNTSQTTILNRTCHYMIAGALMLAAPIALAQDGNTTLGVGAGASITTGDNGTFVGYEAGNLFDNDSDNTMIGAFAGSLGSAGIDNTFVGTRAGMNNIGGDGVFIGSDAGVSNSNGVDNVFVGEEAGRNNTTGSDNVFIGEDAGYYNTTARRNTAVGNKALNMNTTGFGHTALGNEALYDTSTGLKNTGLGWVAGIDIGVGSLNTMVGAAAGMATEHANFNTFVGALAGWDNNRENGTNTANRNTYVGTLAGGTNRKGSHNVVIGALADMVNLSGNSDAEVLAGTSDTGAITTPVLSTAAPADNDVSRVVNVGAVGTVTGDDAIGIGYDNVSSAPRGIAVGSGSQSTHADAIAIGYQAVTHGAQIAVIGNTTTLSIDPGADGVTALGSATFRYSAANAESFNAIADAAAAADMEFVADAGANNDDRWRLRAADSGAFTISSFASGAYVDIISAASNGIVTVAGDVNVNSDRRLKQDIEGIGNALDLLDQVEGRTYHWKPELGRDGRTHYGLIAQEVEAAVPELVTAREADGIKSVNYNGFVPILINAVGELKEQNRKQQEEMVLLREQIALQQEVLEEFLANADAVEIATR